MRLFVDKLWTLCSAFFHDHWNENSVNMSTTYGKFDKEHVLLIKLRVIPGYISFKLNWSWKFFFIVKLKITCKGIILAIQISFFIPSRPLLRFVQYEGQFVNQVLSGQNLFLGGHTLF